MKPAVCVILPLDQLSTVLGISRRDNASKWGFPGGKVDQGESDVAAAVRELFEEVGVELSAEFLRPIYAGPCPGKGPDDSYWVTTYLWTGPIPETATLKAESGLVLKGVCRALLCDARHSPFAGYNREVYVAWDRYRQRTPELHGIR